MSNSTVIQFHAEWCGPCKKVKPELTALIAETDGVDLVLVDIEQNTDLVAKYNVTGVPTIIHLNQQNEEIARVVGARPRFALARELKLAP